MQDYVLNTTEFHQFTTGMMETVKASLYRSMQDIGEAVMVERRLMDALESEAFRERLGDLVVHAAMELGVWPDLPEIEGERISLAATKAA